jgi:hypothetical protein
LIFFIKALTSFPGEMGMAISANEDRFSIGGNEAQECPG